MLQIDSPIYCHHKPNKSERPLKNSPARRKPPRYSQFCPALLTALHLPSPLPLDVCQKKRGLQAMKAHVRGALWVFIPLQCHQNWYPHKGLMRLRASFFPIEDFVPENSQGSLKLGLEILKPKGYNQEAPNTCLF